MVENILYTFRRCPYAMRARWALLETKEVVTCREVLLRKKPKELLEISPKGTVPVLQTACGEVIEESLQIMQWSLKKNKMFDFLLDKDPLAQKEINYIISKNDVAFKYHLDRYKYANNFVLSERNFHKNSAREILIEWNSKLSSKTNKKRKWLVRGQESLADWAIWPFVRQYRSIEPILFEEDKEITPLKEWLYLFLESSKFRQLMLKSKPWCPGDEPRFFPPNNQLSKIS